MLRECRERFHRHRLQRKPLVNDPGMHHGTCVTHVPLCTSGSLTRGGRENQPGIPGARTTRTFTYLVRGPLKTCQSCTQNVSKFFRNPEYSAICSLIFMVCILHGLSLMISAILCYVAYISLYLKRSVRMAGGDTCFFQVKRPHEVMPPRIPKPDTFLIGHDPIPLVMQTRRASNSLLDGPSRQHINTWAS